LCTGALECKETVEEIARISDTQTGQPSVYELPIPLSQSREIKEEGDMEESGDVDDGFMSGGFLNRITAAYDTLCEHCHQRTSMARADAGDLVTSTPTSSQASDVSAYAYSERSANDVATLDEVLRFLYHILGDEVVSKRTIGEKSVKRFTTEGGISKVKREIRWFLREDPEVLSWLIAAAIEKHSSELMQTMEVDNSKQSEDFIMEGLKTRFERANEESEVCEAEIVLLKTNENCPIETLNAEWLILLSFEVEKAKVAVEIAEWTLKSRMTSLKEDSVHEPVAPGRDIKEEIFCLANKKHGLVRELEEIAKDVDHVKFTPEEAASMLQKSIGELLEISGPSTSTAKVVGTDGKEDEAQEMLQEEPEPTAKGGSGKGTKRVETSSGTPGPAKKTRVLPDWILQASQPEEAPAASEAPPQAP